MGMSRQVRILWPQPVQKFAFAGMDRPHFGQSTFAASLLDVSAAPPSLPPAP